MNMTAVGIIALICWMVVSIVKTVQAKEHRKKDNAEHKDLQDYTKEIEKRLEEMSERIATLEKIVTDEKYQLNKEFEKL